MKAIPTKKLYQPSDNIKGDFMFMRRIKSISKQQRGQGIVEFAIVLPVVLLLVFGIIELGFLIFSYSSVNSASREAARYGIAIGNVTGGQRYYDCSGIIDAGLKIGRFAGMDSGDFTIVYDNGPDEGDGTYLQKYSSCTDLASHNGNDSIRFGDRIVVTVNHDYHPLISYMGMHINPFTMTSTSSRTIVKNAEIIPGGGSAGPGGGGGGGGGTPTCYGLTRSYIGSGSPPGVSLTNSTDCGPNNYVAGEVLTLTAYPAVGWTVSSWSGTNNDSSKAITNTLTMPASDHNVVVTYVSGSPTCYPLSLAHTGSGSDPVAAPANSSGCAAGTYVAGEPISLTATPNVGYKVSGWTGTSNNSSTSNTNSLTMPAASHTASVTYIIGP
jgi:hypothetical protein